MSRWLNFNGTFIADEDAVVGAGSRGLRYGDGVFETMKYNGRDIPLADKHLKRFFAGVQKLQISIGMDGDRLLKEIAATLRRNAISGRARIRLMALRGAGSIEQPASTDNTVIIQVADLSDSRPPSEARAVSAVLFKDGVKACDAFSNLKTNNFLIYSAAARWAVQQGADDALLMNMYGRICESSVSNIFWVSGRDIFTPPLSEGCVAGVTREFLLQEWPHITEKVCSLNDLRSADEIFLTNAITGIRCVVRFEGKDYPKGKIAGDIFNHLLARLLL